MILTKRIFRLKNSISYLLDIQVENSESKNTKYSRSFGEMIVNHPYASYSISFS